MAALVAELGSDSSTGYGVVASPADPNPSAVLHSADYGGLVTITFTAHTVGS